MANQAVLACIEEILQLSMNSETPFGSKVIILLGDFRQTCPVIPGGSRAQVVDTSIRSSALWNLITIHRLSIPIHNAQDPDFANFVDSIGDGAGPNIQLNMLKNCSSMEDLVQFAFPDQILNYPEMCFGRAILAPTNAQINDYNSKILTKIVGRSQTFIVSDSLKEVKEAKISNASPDAMLDWAALHGIPGLPTSRLTVKRGMLAHLMRNLSIDRGLVKNARMAVINIGH